MTAGRVLVLIHRSGSRAARSAKKQAVFHTARIVVNGGEFTEGILWAFHISMRSVVMWETQTEVVGNWCERWSSPIRSRAHHDLPHKPHSRRLSPSQVFGSVDSLLWWLPSAKTVINCFMPCHPFPSSYELIKRSMPWLRKPCYVWFFSRQTVEKPDRHPEKPEG